MTETIDMAGLRGKSVLTRDGRRLGDVTDVRIDPKGWRIEALTVKLDRELVTELGMVSKLFGSRDVGIRTEHVHAVSDTILLNTTVAELGASYDATARMAAANAATQPR